MSERRTAGASGLAPESIARAYDRWSLSYDSAPNTTRDLDAEVLRRAPLSLTGRRVLELGCGTGKNSTWLATQAETLVALDFSSGMLALARERVTSTNARFVQHDIRSAWPVDDDGVDVVVGNLVLEHVEHLGPLYAEAARVLPAGGSLFLCELHPYRQLSGAQARFRDDTSEEGVNVPAFLHSTSQYVNLAIAAGFVLRELGEWLEPSAAPGRPPRLISLLFQRA
jgi:ubiquinone/menaquinone biosynthesis C-methylase UbiE